MSIERLDHVVLAVDDIAAAAEAWSRTFRLDATPPEQPANTHMELAFLQLEQPAPSEIEGPALSEAEGAFLELVRGTTPEHRVSRHVAELGEGMFSISLQVDDLDAAVASLRERAVEVSDPEPGVLPGTRVARIPRASAHGVAVQLIER